LPSSFRVNCDPIARVYRWLEYAAFGPALQRRRNAFLPQIAGVSQVLLLGDGDGRFLGELLRRNPHATVDSVDSSGRMLALAQARATRLLGAAAVERQVRFHHADIQAWQPASGRPYDLIVTHFFLDCFNDDALARVLPALGAATAPGARWLVSEFRQPAGHGWAAWRARAWIGGLYLAFSWVTGLAVRRLPDYRRLLLQQDFVLEREGIAAGGLLVSELWRRS
jgi:SAM-dependent methyltransferase